MDEDGGMSKYSTNKAGAKYGTGYCDSQGPRDLKFINGKVSSKSVRKGRAHILAPATPQDPTAHS